MPQLNLQGDIYSSSSGVVNMFDSNGNVNTGIYSQNTTFINSLKDVNNMMQIASSMQSLRARSAIYEMCLSNLGWKTTSKEIHDEVIYKNSTTPKAFFTSTINGATVYSSGLDRKNFEELKQGKTPFTIFAHGFQSWRPECYKAVLPDGRESPVICWENNDFLREVHFAF
jgi:hypothetical protein